MEKGKSKGILFIGLVNFNTETGDAVHFKKLSNFLMQTYEGKFITLTSGKSDENHKKIKFPSNRIFRIIYWNVLIFFYAFLFLNKNRNIKFLYFRESGLIISPYFLKLFFSAKFIVEINGVNIDDLGLPKFITRSVFRLLYRVPDLITASKGYVKLLHQEFLVPLNKFIDVQLGYDPYKPKLKSKCIYDVKIDISKRYLLFIGNVTAYQGLQNIIPALNKIFRLNSDLNLLIVGDGGYMDNIEKLVKYHNIENNTIFVPRVPKEIIKSYVACAEIGLSPFSFDRGIKGSISGLKTFDYLFGEVPILTSEMDDMAEIIKDNGWGEMIKKSDNIEEIQFLIDKLLKDNKRYRENIRNNKDFLYKQFSWENRFSKILKRIEGILS